MAPLLEGVGVDDGAGPVGGGVVGADAEGVERCLAGRRLHRRDGRAGQRLRYGSQQQERQDGERDDVERSLHRVTLPKVWFDEKRDVTLVVYVIGVMT